MNNKPFFINKSAFNELCKYVCYQLQPSGSEQIDKETLNFAIYWQICSLLEKQVELISGLDSKIPLYQQLLQITINDQTKESFDVSKIIEKNFNEWLENWYPKSYNIRNQPKFNSDNSECWGENFAFL